MAKNKESKKILAARAVLNDAFAFVRGYKVNELMRGVTLDVLMAEQIARDGEGPSQYDPYAGSGLPSGSTVSQSKPANYVSGTNITNPTKLDRLSALSNVIENTVSAIRNTDPADMQTKDEYWDNSR